MACSHCDDLHREVPIRSPRELRKALRVIDANLADRTLRLVAGELPGSEREEPPPDVISAEFECRHCRQGFTLGVDLYHGRGGSWGPVDPRLA